MNRSRAPSPVARAVLAALAESAPGWSYGYALCRQAGVKSGTLYPLLIRLEAQGCLEAQWLPAETGRPPRHAYRLTTAGLRLAQAHPPAVPTPDAAPRGRPA